MNLRPTLDAISHFDQGNFLMKNGHFHQAAKEYLRAIEIDPEATGAYINLGLCYTELTDHRRAIECCSKAIALEPNNLEAHLNFACILADLEQWEASLIEFAEAQRLAPKNRDVYRGRALIFISQNKPVFAIPEILVTLRLCCWDGNTYWVAKIGIEFFFWSYVIKVLKRFFDFNLD